MVWCCASTVDRTEEADGAEVVNQTVYTDGEEACLAVVTQQQGSAAEAIGRGSPAKAASTPGSKQEVFEEAHAEEASAWAAEQTTEAAAAEQPQAEDAPFDVTLEMHPGEKLGALLDVLDMKTLRVVSVKRNGHLQRYNNRVEPNKQVLAGYYIVSVNGKSGKVDDMVEELRHSRTWKLRIARKLQFTINVEKSKPLALDLQFEPESDCILVRKVGESGLMSEYNQRAPDGDKQVLAGDRIIDVNQATGPAKTLLETLRSNRDLSLTIARPLLK